MDLSGISSSWVRKGLWPPWSRRMPSSTTCFKNCLFRTRALCQETTYQLIKTFSGNISQIKHLLCSHNICYKIENIFDTFDRALFHIHCCFYLYPPHEFMIMIISKVRSDHYQHHHHHDNQDNQRDHSGVTVGQRFICWEMTSQPNCGPWYDQAHWYHRYNFNVVIIVTIRWYCTGRD